QGCQYTSTGFGQRCREMGVRPSMGSVGDAYDNALCESFFATLECELLDRTRFKTQVDARLAVFEFIEGWYNPHRRHSALDYLSLINLTPRDFRRRAQVGAVPIPTGDDRESDPGVNLRPARFAASRCLGGRSTRRTIPPAWNLADRQGRSGRPRRRHLRQEGSKR